MSDGGRDDDTVRGSDDDDTVRGSDDDYAVLGREDVYTGPIISLHRDRVRMPDGSVATRDVIDHIGAVAVVALDESHGPADGPEVVLVNQFRHPVRQRLDECPAGLLDVDGESALAAAKRELVEEARLVADRWDVLLDLYTSPGYSSEAIRVFLARGLGPADSDFAPESEELTMTARRVPLADAVRSAATGAITNGVAVASLLAAAHGLATGWRDLRPADAPWPAKPGR